MSEERVNTGTADGVQENIEQLGRLFPQVLTEVAGEDGEPHRAVDFDALRQLLGDVAEGGRERYQFTWPGKSQAKDQAYTSISKTLRPVKDKSKNWDDTENLYIEGDNLDALKLLRETYAGKVKLIYIDPPYNTGQDFIYKDDYAMSREDYEAASGDFDEEGGRLVSNTREGNGRFHSDWCSMMYPRLLLARDLLREDGAIFISIANQEFATLKMIADEVFGISSCLGILVWESKTKCQNTKTARRQLQAKQEYILAYQKGADRYEFNLEISGQRLYDRKDERGIYRLKKIETMSSTGIRGRETMIFPILGIEPPEGRQWQYGQEYIDTLAKRGDLLVNQGQPYYKCRPDDEEAQMKPFWSLLPAKPYGTAETAKADLKKLIGESGLNTVKPVELLKSLISHVASNDSDSIILDFFSGSATTADAVMQLNAEDGGNRKFIMVQLPEPCEEGKEAAKAGYATICEIGQERIRRAGDKIADEVKEGNQQLKIGEEPKVVPDIGFRVLAVDSSNIRDVSATPRETGQAALFDAVDNVKPDRDALDLLFEVLPAFRIPYSAPIEVRKLAGRECFFVDGTYLIACFDADVTTATIEAIAREKPVYAVVRDASLADDATQANFEELFRTHSPATVRRVI